MRINFSFLFALPYSGFMLRFFGLLLYIRIRNLNLVKYNNVRKVFFIEIRIVDIIYANTHTCYSLPF